MENLIGIYTTKYTENNNAIKLENMGTIDKTQVNSITDQQLDMYEIKKHVQGFMYKCNMTHFFLMSTKKLPVAYINICYTKYPLKVVLLYRIFIYFNIGSIEHIKSMDDLVNKELPGVFSLEVSIGDKIMDIGTVEDGNNFNGELNNKIVELSKSAEMLLLIDDLIKDVEHAMSIEYKEDELFEMPNIKPKGSASLPKGSASLPKGSASLPKGSASLPKDNHLSDK